MVDFRFRDLMPGVPIDGVETVMEVYADGIGTLELLGNNIRVTYITWGVTPGSSLLRRIAVVKVTRPRRSFLSTAGGVPAILGDAEPIRVASEMTAH